MKSILPNEKRAKLALTLIWAIFVLEIISLISGFFTYNMYQNILNGYEVSEDLIDAYKLRNNKIDLVYLILRIISAYTFIQWFRRAYFNLHIKVKELSFTENWAAICWFVPFLNFYRPYQIMKELFSKTKDYLVLKKLEIGKGLELKYLRWWWTLWILSIIIGQISSRMSYSSVTREELSAATFSGIISNFFGIILSIITIKIIKDYSKVEYFLD